MSGPSRARYGRGDQNASIRQREDRQGHEAFHQVGRIAVCLIGAGEDGGGLSDVGVGKFAQPRCEPRCWKETVERWRAVFDRNADRTGSERAQDGGPERRRSGREQVDIGGELLDAQKRRWAGMMRGLPSQQQQRAGAVEHQRAEQDQQHPADDAETRHHIRLTGADRM